MGVVDVMDLAPRHFRGSDGSITSGIPNDFQEYFGGVPRSMPEEILEGGRGGPPGDLRGEGRRTRTKYRSPSERRQMGPVLAIQATGWTMLRPGEEGKRGI